MKTVMLAAAAALAVGAAASQAHADVFDFQLTSTSDSYTFSLNTAVEQYQFFGFDYGTVPVTDNNGTTMEDVSTFLASSVSGTSFSFEDVGQDFITDNTASMPPSETFNVGTYQGTDTAIGVPETLVISQPGTVSAAPEPATWLLMFAGIGGIGLMLRRAKKTMGFRFKDALAA